MAVTPTSLRHPPLLALAQIDPARARARVLAAREDLRLLDLLPAGGRLAHGGARVEPAAAPRLRRRLGVLQIAGEEAVARALGAAPAHGQLALGAARRLAISVVHDARLQAAERAPERARGDLPRLAMVGVDASRLRHAPHLDQREAEALLESLVQLG